MNFDVQEAFEYSAEFDHFYWREREKSRNPFQLDQRKFRLSWEEPRKSSNLIRCSVKKQAKASIKFLVHLNPFIFSLIWVANISDGVCFFSESVFVEVGPILRSAIDGHNVCILAYGQTGTGKTFSMVRKKMVFKSSCTFTSKMISIVCLSMSCICTTLIWFHWLKTSYISYLL